MVQSHGYEGSHLYLEIVPRSLFFAGLMLSVFHSYIQNRVRIASSIAKKPQCWLPVNFVRRLKRPVTDSNHFSKS
jgi:hypothetical protein